MESWAFSYKTTVARGEWCKTTSFEKFESCSKTIAVIAP